MLRGDGGAEEEQRPVQQPQLASAAAVAPPPRSGEHGLVHLQDSYGQGEVVTGIIVGSPELVATVCAMGQNPVSWP